MLKQAPLVAAFGRVLIAAIFLVSGVFKVTAPAMTMAYIGAVHLPFPLLAYIVAVAIEIGGGVLLILGLRARVVSAVIAVYCVATALGFHDNFADPNQMMNFLKNISMAGGLLQIAAFGAGSFSLDDRRAGARPAAQARAG